MDNIKSVLDDPRNIETMNQFFLDANVGAIRCVVDMDKAQACVKDLLDSKRKSPEPGDLIVSFDITQNGGTISFYQMRRRDSVSESIERRNHFNARSSACLLIEPNGYPEIEPYNRQSPYYIGFGYRSLDKHVTDIFSIYTLKELFDGNRDIYASFDEFYYNPFWKSIRCGLIVEKSDLNELFTKLFSIIGFENDVLNVVLNDAERFVNTMCVDKDKIDD